MKHPLFLSLRLAVLAGFSLITPAWAVTMDYVPVGNAGNAADPSTGFGAVGHAYQIGKYEVTNNQYVEFLNAKAQTDTYSLYNQNMGNYGGIAQDGSPGSHHYSVTGGLGNRPVVYVSWFDAARFTNWLGNGQGNGSTETGAYTLISGQTTGIVTVNPGAQIYLPSENEWYKAAYYNGGTSTYSLYPNGQNTITTADANYDHSVDASTAVGSYSGDPSSYGTFDQGGNVWEWNDAVISRDLRGLRGGSWADIGDGGLQSSLRNGQEPPNEAPFIGFRVASVPEPTSSGANFRVTSVSVMSGGNQLQLTWTSDPSASYSIEDSPDLTAQSWTEVATGIQSQGSSTTHTLAITPSQRRFFRVAKRP